MAQYRRPHSGQRSRKRKYTHRSRQNNQFAFRGACHCAAFFFLAIVWCEIVARSVIADSIFGIGIMYRVLFAIPAALIITVYTHLFLPRIGMLLAGATVIGLTGFYMIQVVAFQRYGTVITPGAQLTASASLTEALGSSILVLGALLVPAVAWFLLLSHHSFYHPGRRVVVAGILCALITHLVCMLSTVLGGFGAESAFSLYFRTSNPLASARTLGIAATFRLETQRNVLGFPLFGKSEPSAEQSEEEVTETAGYTSEQYHVMDIAFDELLTDLSGRIAALSERTGEAETPKQLEECQQLLELDTFFSNRTPTKKNEHTGIYEGYNLIYLTVDSLIPYAIDAERTPTLYQMQTQGYQFEHFYTSDWANRIADGEFVNLLSLYPEQQDGVNGLAQAAEYSLPFAPGNLLREQGYASYAYYSGVFDEDSRSTFYPAMGYTYRSVTDVSSTTNGGEDAENNTTISDSELISATVSDYLSQDQFHVYYVAAGTDRQEQPEEQANEEQQEQQSEEETISRASQAYLDEVAELDKALQLLLEQLEQAGVAERTIIAVAPAHTPELTEEQITELRGGQPKNALERAESCFLLYVPGQEHETISTPCSNMDILPTLYNLMGLAYDSRLLMGTDVFSDTTPTVALQDGSWIAKQVQYDAATGRAETYVYSEAGGSLVNDATRETITAQIQQMQAISAEMLKIDYFKHIGM